jgi:hypothetical protein
MVVLLITSDLHNTVKKRTYAYGREISFEVEIWMLTSTPSEEFAFVV